MTAQNIPLVTALAIETSATVGALPIGQPEGSIRYVLSNDTLYTYDGASWTAVAGGGGGGAVDSVNGQTGVVVLDTDDVNEGSTNLYYTNERVDDRVAVLIQNGTGISWTYSDAGGTLTPAVTLAPFSTTNLAEGTNLYYTNVRADARITAQKGVANGIAPLDSGAKIDVAYLPNSVMDYLGTWAASTNTPTLANGTGNAGDVYVASDAGTVNFGAGGITFAAGDWVIYSGTVWQKSVNSNAVASVNGFTGAVVLTTTDIAEGTNLYFTNERSDDRTAALIQNGTGLAWTYNDAGNTLTGNVSLGSFSTTNLNEGSNLYYTDERVDDRVAALLVAGTAISLTYSDVGGTLTVAAIVASNAAAGVVSTSAQSLAGLKTFEGGLSSAEFVGTNPQVGGSSPFQLTNAHKRVQIIDPAGDIVVRLPDDILAGESVTIVNRSQTNVVTIETQDTTVQYVLVAGRVTFTANTNNPDNGGYDVTAASSKHVSQVQTSQDNASTNTKIKRFVTLVEEVGDAITYAETVADGSSWTLNRPGFYTFTSTYSFNTAGAQFGLSRNSNQLTTDIVSITAANRLALTFQPFGSASSCCYSWTGWCNVGDVLRVHTDGTADGTAALANVFVSYSGC